MLPATHKKSRQVLCSLLRGSCRKAWHPGLGFRGIMLVSTGPLDPRNSITAVRIGNLTGFTFYLLTWICLVKVCKVLDISC